MEVKKYVNEILDIAVENDVSWDIGLDMFLANVRNCGEPDTPYYPGAFVDYAALKPELEAMTDAQVADMKNDFAYWYRANADEIRQARYGAAHE